MLHAGGGAGGARRSAAKGDQTPGKGGKSGVVPSKGRQDGSTTHAAPFTNKGKNKGHNFDNQHQKSSQQTYNPGMKGRRGDYYFPADRNESGGHPHAANSKNQHRRQPRSQQPQQFASDHNLQHSHSTHTPIDGQELDLPERHQLNPNRSFEVRIRFAVALSCSDIPLNVNDEEVAQLATFLSLHRIGLLKHKHRLGRLGPQRILQMLCSGPDHKGALYNEQEFIMGAGDHYVQEVYNFDRVASAPDQGLVPGGKKAAPVVPLPPQLSDIDEEGRAPPGRSLEIPERQRTIAGKQGVGDGDGSSSPSAAGRSAGAATCSTTAGTTEEAFSASGTASRTREDGGSSRSYVYPGSRCNVAAGEPHPPQPEDQNSAARPASFSYKVLSATSKSTSESTQGDDFRLFQMVLVGVIVHQNHKSCFLLVYPELLEQLTATSTRTATTVVKEADFFEKGYLEREAARLVQARFEAVTPALGGNTKVDLSSCKTPPASAATTGLGSNVAGVGIPGSSSPPRRSFDPDQDHVKESESTVPAEEGEGVGDSGDRNAASTASSELKTIDEDGQVRPQDRLQPNANQNPNQETKQTGKHVKQGSLHVLRRKVIFEVPHDLLQQSLALYRFRTRAEVSVGDEDQDEDEGGQQEGASFADEDNQEPAAPAPSEGASGEDVVPEEAAGRSAGSRWGSHPHQTQHPLALVLGLNEKVTHDSAVTLLPKPAMVERCMAGGTSTSSTGGQDRAEGDQHGALGVGLTERMCKIVSRTEQLDHPDGAGAEPVAGEAKEQKAVDKLYESQLGVLFSCWLHDADEKNLVANAVAATRGARKSDDAALRPQQDDYKNDAAGSSSAANPHTQEPPLDSHQAVIDIDSGKNYDYEQRQLQHVEGAPLSSTLLASGKRASGSSWLCALAYSADRADERRRVRLVPLSRLFWSIVGRRSPTAPGEQHSSRFAVRGFKLWLNKPKQSEAELMYKKSYHQAELAGGGRTTSTEGELVETEGGAAVTIGRAMDGFTALWRGRSRGQSQGQGLGKEISQSESRSSTSAAAPEPAQADFFFMSPKMRWHLEKKVVTEKGVEFHCTHGVATARMRCTLLAFGGAPQQWLEVDDLLNNNYKSSSTSTGAPQVQPARNDARNGGSTRGQNSFQQQRSGDYPPPPRGGNRGGRAVENTRMNGYSAAEQSTNWNQYNNHGGPPREDHYHRGRGGGGARAPAWNDHYDRGIHHDPEQTARHDLRQHHRYHDPARDRHARDHHVGRDHHMRRSEEQGDFNGRGPRDDRGYYFDEREDLHEDFLHGGGKLRGGKARDEYTPKGLVLRPPPPGMNHNYNNHMRSSPRGDTRPEPDHPHQRGGQAPPASYNGGHHDYPSQPHHYTSSDEEYHRGSHPSSSHNEYHRGPHPSSSHNAWLPPSSSSFGHERKQHRAGDRGHPMRTRQDGHTSHEHERYGSSSHISQENQNLYNRGGGRGRDHDLQDEYQPDDRGGRHNNHVNNYYYNKGSNGNRNGNLQLHDGHGEDPSRSRRLYEEEASYAARGWAGQEHYSREAGGRGGGGGTRFLQNGSTPGRHDQHDEGYFPHEGRPGHRGMVPAPAEPSAGISASRPVEPNLSSALRNSTSGGLYDVVALLQTLARHLDHETESHRLANTQEANLRSPAGATSVDSAITGTNTTTTGATGGMSSGTTPIHHLAQAPGATSRGGNTNLRRHHVDPRFEVSPDAQAMLVPGQHVAPSSSSDEELPTAGGAATSFIGEELTSLTTTALSTDPELRSQLAGRLQSLLSGARERESTGGQVQQEEVWADNDHQHQYEQYPPPARSPPPKPPQPPRRGAGGREPTSRDRGYPGY